MTRHSYDVNGLLEVLVAPQVRPEIVREIDFQIGFFRSNVTEAKAGCPRIYVRPFSDWKAESSEEKNATTFYGCNGQPGISIVDEFNRLGIAKEINGFTIYADNPNFLINLYIQLLIAPIGYTMAHAAGYLSSSGTVTLVAGAGGIGKTAILGHAVRKRGCKHLGDDVVILSKSGSCFAFPRAFVLKPYHREVYSETFQRLRMPRWNLYKTKRFLVENAPFIGLGKQLLRRMGLYYWVGDLLRPQPHLGTVSSEEIFGRGSVAHSGEIGRVVYLDRVGSDTFQLLAMGLEELANRLLSVIHYEWKDFLGHLMSLGALHVVDLSSYFTDVIRNLHEVLRDKELMNLRVPSDAGPSTIIEFLDHRQFF